MNTNTPENGEGQEIDFTQISTKISSLFGVINNAIFRTIQFVIKNAIVLVALVLFGFGIGLYLDKTTKSYNSEIIVAPNFGSTDYLYSKVDLLSAKIKEGDTLFFKSIGIEDADNIKKITIEPIVDVFSFINSNQQNFDLLKLMTEDADFQTIVKENMISKNYSFHTITILTKDKMEKETRILPLLNYLNSSDYFTKIQKISLANIQQKISTSEETVLQIDGFLNEFSNNASGKNQKSDKLVYYNENTQLNDVIKTKEELIKQIGNLKLALTNSDKIIKDIVVTSNIKNTKNLNGKRKMVIPFLFVFGFIFLMMFKNFYISQKRNTISRA